MDQAMGLGKSWLSAAVFSGGTAGLLTAVGLTFIPSFFLYKVIVHGKPYNPYTTPAFFPIFFELTVLFSAFTAVFALMIFNQLPRWYHPIFNWERFKRVTNDGFFLSLRRSIRAFRKPARASCSNQSADSMSPLFTTDHAALLFLRSSYFRRCRARVGGLPWR
jgi:hypothetical protein